MNRLPLFVLSASLLACAGSGAKPAPGGDGVPQSDFEVVPGFGQLDGGSLDLVTGVAVDANNRVYVISTRGRQSPNHTIIDEPTIFVFDGETSELLDQLGAGLFLYPHAITIGPEGNLWVTDSDQNRVFKLDPKGHVLLTLGKP